MAVNLLAILVICKAIFTVALNLEPPELLGPHTDDPTRWPYGGCAEVVKIYPAPGSHLPPPPEIYADDWNVTITVVFSRPVTRILWDYDIRIWLRNVSLSKDNEVLSCAKQACLIFVHNGKHIHQKAVSAGPTERGNIFSDEYQFTFRVPTYVKDHMSEVYFALDGGWMYSPVYKFITNADVEYVPYVAVRYLPPSASSKPPERDTNYWVNHPSTCAVRSGLLYRPFTFSRAKREQQMTTANTPKLLAELTELVVKEASERGQQRKLRLYYQIRQSGVHTVKVPDSIKLVDKDTNQNVSFSSTVQSLIIDFTSPRLYIPVKETSFVFDYRERAYYEPPKWNAYFFTLKNGFSEMCRNSSRSFDCNTFQYSQVFPSPSLHSHHITAQSLSDGYRTTNIKNYGLQLEFYHQLTFPENKQFYKIIPLHLFQRYSLYSRFLDCLRVRGINYHHVCYIEGWNPFIRDFSPRNLTVLVLNPYWKLVRIRDSHSDEAIDHFMMSNEIPKTVYKSEGISVPQKVSGMMHLSTTGSLYEKNMDNIIPLLKFHDKFQHRNNYRMMKLKCPDNFKRNVGKWGAIRSYIEYGNIYQLHVSKPASNWTVQQTMSVKQIDRNGRQLTLNTTIISVPEHIKRAVEQYAVLTNVHPSVYTIAQRDTRLKATKESYPLEKAVFVPRELINKHGCGTLRITEIDINKYSSNSYKDRSDPLCHKSPDDCTGLPLDSLDRFPLIPPFNVLDLNGPIDLLDVSRGHHRRALYYRDNTVNNLFILNSPNSYYTGVVEISGVEIKEPEFVKKSCNDLWEFSPDRYEITKGHLTATMVNKGEGGSDVVLSVRCTPKLAVFPEKVTVWVTPHQTKTVRFVLGGHRHEGKEGNIIMYKCNVSISINTAPFASVIGKTFPTCNLFIPTFSGYFVDPCNNTHSNHDIVYYHLPKEFVHRFSLREFRESDIGRGFLLLKLISIQLVKYHMIRLSCKNNNVWAITEDQLISSSWSTGDRDINLVYSIDKLLQEKVYIFMRRGSIYNVETRCLLTLISTPFSPCEVVTRKYIVLTKADIPVAAALQREEEEMAAKRLALLEYEQRSWYESISEREEVLTAILVCLITSLILIVFIATGNSALLLYDKYFAPQKKIELLKLEIQQAKQQYEETWKNPVMYLKSGILGPHYVLQNFKATDALDISDLRMLKLSGVLRYRDKEVHVIVEYIDKITIKKPFDGKKPNEVWLKASTGMYLLKQKHVSEEYKEQFGSFLEQYMERYKREN